LDGKQTSILDVAQSKNIGVFSSVPFMQGRLLDENASPKVDGYTPVTLALQFIRSTPGILAPLVGQKSESHVAENLQVMKMPPLNETEFYDLVKKLTQPN
jgi:aryl-alcohol dehydrogenase-like predicted oxidoreductase